MPGVKKSYPRRKAARKTFFLKVKRSVAGNA